MKKFLNSFKFVFKATLLILLLVLGWAFVNVTNWVKGKKSSDKDIKTSDLFGAGRVDADVFGAPKATTPFLAYFDGTEYRLENDILFGRPNSFYHNYTIAKELYEDGRIFPDLYKITAPVKAVGNKLLFQIQEIEPEESFFKWLELDRVVHPKNTEVVVDSDFKKFYALDRSVLAEKLITPASVIDAGGQDWTRDVSDKDSLWQYDIVSGKRIEFSPNESVDIIFRNLKPNEAPYLITKTWFRDWVPGNAIYRQKVYAADLFSVSGLRKISAFIALIVAGAVHYKLGSGSELFALIPVVFGVQCVSCDPGCACLSYGYKDEDGQYQWVNINGVRSWKYNSEIIEFPREAVNSKGEMALRVHATQKHALGFVGLLEESEILNAARKNYKVEKLGLRRAYHNRLRSDVSATLRKGYWKEYVHTIPGDKVDLEFDAPASKPAKNEKETYLLRSSGFYTSLRSEYKKVAGNWQERISEEAKSRLAALAPINKYQ